MGHQLQPLIKDQPHVIGTIGLLAFGVSVVEHVLIFFRFGIILSEVITHDGPYATERAILTDMEIINLVRYLDSPENNDAKLVCIYTS